MKWILIVLLTLVGLEGFSQNSSSARIGAGVVYLGGSYGIGGSTELLFPLSKNFSYGLDIGYAMASDKLISTEMAGAYSQHSISSGDFCILYNPEVLNKIRLTLKVGGGIRHLNSTQVLVNSSLVINPTNDRSTGVGLQSGIGLDYSITENSFLGLYYFHDFYKEDFDYLGIRLGINLKL